MRPLIDEARHLEIRKLVGEEAYRELLDQFCLDAAWILEGFALGSGEDSLRRSRHALTGLAANFGLRAVADRRRSRNRPSEGRARQHPRPALPRNRILRLTLGPKQGAPVRTGAPA